MNWFPLGVGNLDPYVEKGTQGVSWALHDNTLPGYHGLLVLQNGDWLRVFDENEQVLWDALVVFDYDASLLPDPDDIFFSQQVVNGQTVNGLLKGVDPEVWASWFSRRLRAAAFRSADALSAPSLSPLIKAVDNLDVARWAWRAPTRFFDGFSELPLLEQHRITGDLQPAVSWIAHKLGWSAHDVANSLDIPAALADEWAAPADLPWHRSHLENPAWATRGAYLLALYAHLHWTLGERVANRDDWPAAAARIVASARQSFPDLTSAVAELAPDPDLLNPPPPLTRTP